jgi:hypothetical protein
MFVAFGLLTFSAYSQATVIQLMSPSEMTAGGTVLDYPEPKGTYIASPYVRTAGTNTVTFSNANTPNPPNPQSFYRLDQDDGWAGGYPAGTHLLYSLNSNYLDIAFGNTVSEVGFHAQSSSGGSQSFSFQIFEGATSLGTFTAGNGGDGLTFIGARAAAGHSISRIRVTQVEGTFNPEAFFTISPITFKQGPPPVEVEKIQYKASGTFVDASGTLYVYKGDTVNFKAIPRPANGTWPTGKPIWGGTSGATGTGATTSVTFSELSASTSDFKTVTAESGNTVTVDVIVYQLKADLTPQDNFSGRSNIQYGLGEKIDLSFTSTPAGVTSAQAGGLMWTIDEGGGSLLGNTNGIDTYTAPVTAGPVTLKLKVLTGPSKNRGPSPSRQIIAPSGAHMRKKPGTGVIHNQGNCSVGFLGEAFLHPKNVSFINIRFAEGNGTAVASGYYAANDGDVHQLGAENVVMNCNTSTGCYAFDDLVLTDGPPPFSDGDFLWPIEWQYVTGSGDRTTFFIANHHQIATPTGRCTIEKAGAGPFTKNANAPTSF